MGNRNSTRATAILGTAVFAAMASSASAAILYSPVVTEVGDGTTALSSAAATTTIQVWRPSILNQALPVAASAYANASSATANNGLVTLGSSTTEGQLTNNPGLADAATKGLAYAGTAYVFSGGYSSADGTAGANGNTVAANRVVGYMTVTSNSVGGAAISAPQTNAAAYTGGNMRGAEGDDAAANFWSAGTGGTTAVSGWRYANSGGTQLSTSVTNVRNVQIRQGRLYGSSSSGAFVGVSVIGSSGVPTGSGNTATNLFESGANSTVGSPDGFVMFDDPNVGTPAGVPFNVIYVADAGSGTGSNPGIEKWVYNGTSWEQSLHDQ